MANGCVAILQDNGRSAIHRCEELNDTRAYFGGWCTLRPQSAMSRCVRLTVPALTSNSRSGYACTALGVGRASELRSPCGPNGAFGGGRRTTRRWKTLGKLSRSAEMCSLHAAHVVASTQVTSGRRNISRSQDNLPRGGRQELFLQGSRSSTRLQDAGVTERLQRNDRFRIVMDLATGWQKPHAFDDNRQTVTDAAICFLKQFPPPRGAILPRCSPRSVLTSVKRLQFVTHKTANNGIGILIQAVTWAGIRNGPEDPRIVASGTS
ncbi:hypothetical protein BC629DRAFT_1439005 [Irpex lacteus]|nr:hypothetical protein BC629DRAFT_1439005 [Irpex lacteus]